MKPIASANYFNNLLKELEDDSDDEDPVIASFMKRVDPNNIKTQQVNPVFEQKQV